MKENINIDTKTFIRFWLVVIGFGLLALAIYKSLSALIIIGFSFFLAIALNPPVSRIAKALSSKSRVISTAIAYVVVISALGVFAFLVVPPVFEQTSKFVQTVPSLLDSATTQYSGVRKFAANYKLEPQFDEVVNSIKSGANQFASGFGANLIAGIGSILSILTSAIIVLALTFLMLVEGPVWMNRIWDLYKNQNRMAHHRATVNKMYSVITSYVAGQLTISAIDGLLAGTVVFILSLTLGTSASLIIPTVAIMFVLSLIPFFGATVGAVFVSLVLAIHSPTVGIIFMIYFLLYQQVEGSFIAPKIQGKKLNLSPLIVLISIIVGLVLFGIVGSIISIPIAGCVKILLDNYLNKSKDKVEVGSVI